MKLRNLLLTDIRSYHKRTFEFRHGLTVIIGENTAGKTNILEALYVASYGKSFRAVKDSDMVAWGSEVGHIDVTADHGDEERRLRVTVTTGTVNGEKAQTKKYVVNGIPRRSADFIGQFKAALFAPSDLDLVTGSPGERRRYLDAVLSQTDREYRRTLASYERGLRQRNSLLTRIRDGEGEIRQLFFWNQLLIKTGSYITSSRERYVTYLNSTTTAGLTYQVLYDPSIISTQRLEQYKDAEIGAGVTLVGPQRDDFHIHKIGIDRIPDESVDTRDVARFGSRGEQRLAVLWLKFSELSFIESVTGERPVLLLDDIFSELDSQSRQIVLSVVGLQQTIMTSAEPSIRDELIDMAGIEWVELAGRWGENR
jgi:DNA replication and repair protein RecF